jgi:iron-sulfur cluster assembly protein
MTRERPALMTITEAAAEWVKQQLAKRSKPAIGIRLGVRPKGCSGLSYTLEYADERGPFDDIVEAHGVTLLVDPKAVMFIIGTEMDWAEDRMQQGLVLRNPNERGRCGCGKSFHV